MANRTQTVSGLTVIDLSAAFDTVDHKILLKVLDVNFGIRGVTLDWISTCLINRSFRVNVTEPGVLRATGTPFRTDSVTDSR